MASRESFAREASTFMRSHTVRARLLLTVWIVLLIAPGVACNDVAPIDNNADKASENAALGGYTVPERSDDELSAALLDVCTEARDDAKPLLVEFSAPWCSDCRKLHQMKQDPALARELQRWATLTINVALFDRQCSPTADRSEKKPLLESVSLVTSGIGVLLPDFWVGSGEVERLEILRHQWPKPQSLADDRRLQVNIIHGRRPYRRASS